MIWSDHLKTGLDSDDSVLNNMMAVWHQLMFADLTNRADSDILKAGTGLLDACNSGEDLESPGSDQHWGRIRCTEPWVFSHCPVDFPLVSGCSVPVLTAGLEFTELGLVQA